MSKTILGRAGSVLDHRFTYGVRGSDGRQHGLVDPTQRVFQGGGRLRDLVFWKRRLVGFEPDVWKVITGGDVDTIELLDHDRPGEYLRIDVRSAEALAEEYTAGLGRRVGVPLEAFDRCGSGGRVLQPRKRHAGGSR